MLRNAVRFLVRAAVVVGVAASFSTGCARQAEGERCDFTWAGDQDCDEGLVCTPCGKLQQGGKNETKSSRCCLPNGSYTDTRCIPTTSPTEDVCNTHLSDEGTGGSGTAGGGGTAGTGTAGTGTAGTGTAGTGTGGATGEGGTAGEGGNGAASGTGATDGG